MAATGEIMSAAEIRPEGIGSAPLSDTVKAVLLDRIMSGMYEPGERIVESRLAKELRISQSPVREALRDLAAIGLVKIESRRGASVRRPTAKELSDVSQVRAEIDALAAMLATERLTDEELDRLAAANQTMEDCYEREDYVEMSKADAEFHRMIVAASGNGAAQRVFNQLEPFARTFITLTLPTVEISGILAQHHGILEALVARDAELAAQRAREHQLSVRELFFNSAIQALEIEQQ